MTEINVALNALRKDAESLEATSTSLGNAANAIDGLTASTFTFSEYGVDACTVYGEIQGAVADLLVGGKTQMHNASAALLDVADAFQRNEEQATQDIGNLWSF